jgi:hypothetical protein
MKKYDSVIAEGEATGHAHRLAVKTDVYERDDGVREFSIERDTDLIHEEHDVITLPAQEYESGIVREYDYFEEEARQVMD